MAAAPITYVRHAMPAVEEGVDPARLAPRRRHPAHAHARGRTGSRWASGIGVLVVEHRAEGPRDGRGHRRAVAGRGQSRTSACARPSARGSAPATGPSPTATSAASPDGWEPHAAVAARMARRGRRRARGRGRWRRSSIVGHGLALSIHLGDRLGSDFDRESFWSRLAFPDAWALDATTCSTGRCRRRA